MVMMIRCSMECCGNLRNSDTRAGNPTTPRAHRPGHRHGQRNEVRQGHRHHAAQHDKLALREVQHARGAVNQVEADRHHGVDAAFGDAGQQVLEG